MGVSGRIKTGRPGWLLVEGHERAMKVFNQRMTVSRTLRLTATHRNANTNPNPNPNQYERQEGLLMWESRDTLVGQGSLGEHESPCAGNLTLTLALTVTPTRSPNPKPNTNLNPNPNRNLEPQLEALH